MNRRQFVRSLAGAGALAALGAPAAGSDSTSPPTVPTEALAAGGWERTEEVSERVFEESFGGATVRATGHTVVYENRALRDEIAKKTAGEIEFAPSSFFATRVEFSTPVSALPGDAERRALEAETERAARESFEERLRDYGLTDVEAGAEDELTVETGETATRTPYDATYDVAELSVEVGGEELVLEPEPLAVGGQLALWGRGDDVLVAGGGYPAENFAQTFRESLTGAIDVTVEIDLGLDPEAYERELVSLATAVS